MNREVHVRICGGRPVRFRPPTRRQRASAGGGAGALVAVAGGAGRGRGPTPADRGHRRGGSPPRRGEPSLAVRPDGYRLLSRLGAADRVVRAGGDPLRRRGKCPPRRRSGSPPARTTRAAAPRRDSRRSSSGRTASDGSPRRGGEPPRRWPRSVAVGPRPRPAPPATATSAPAPPPADARWRRVGGRNLTGRPPQIRTRTSRFIRL